MKSKQLFLFVVFFGFFLTAIAQPISKNNIDSLLVIWENVSQPDTTRMKAIETIAKEGYRFKNPDSSFFYGKMLYDFAKSIDNKKYQLLALNIQGDSYLLKGDTDNALDILNDALLMSETLKDKKLKITTLGNITRVIETRGEIEKALEYNLQILQLSEAIQDTESIGKSLTNIGENYVKKGDFPQGLEYLRRSKKIFETLENEYNIVKVQSSIAKIYMQQGDLDEAAELIQLNLEYFQKTGNKTLMAGCLSNLGGIYARKGNNKKALTYLEEALTYFEDSGNTPYIAALSQNIGFMHYDEGNLERALNYLNKSLKLSQAIKNETFIAGAKSKIGIILNKKGKYTEAIKSSTDALRFYTDSEDLLNIQSTSANLASSYKSIGNYQKALEMNELHYRMRDSLHSIENQKALIELQVQSDYDKQKAIDDVENQKEIAIATQKTNAQRNISIAIGVALVLISLLAYIIFNRLKVTRQQKGIIEEQKRKVEQSEKYKEQFLANMSHEIRTPMHAISGMTKILKRNDHLPAQDVFINAIETSSENMIVILNDVLDISKIEAGKLEVESIPMSPLLVIENIIQLLKFKAEEKGLKLTYQIANDVPPLIMGDPTRLNQILLNLTGNAIKFTEKGSVEITLKVENEQLVFAVKDTGIGVAKDKVDAIFEAFEQAKGSTSRYYGGTGLGLSISKQLVALQNGTIWLESTEGTGSTFFVSLPLKIADSNAVETKLISEEKLKSMCDSLMGIRILIAEDNPFNQMIAQDDLTFHIPEIQLEIAENGVLAVDKFKTSEFDLILMDVQMPEMNGFDATKKIREIEISEARDAKIPVIAMTASLLNTEIDSCYKAGMDNYIPKPYSREELIGTIFSEFSAKSTD